MWWWARPSRALLVGSVLAGPPLVVLLAAVEIPTAGRPVGAAQFVPLLVTVVLGSALLPADATAERGAVAPRRRLALAVALASSSVTTVTLAASARLAHAHLADAAAVSRNSLWVAALTMLGGAAGGWRAAWVPVALVNAAVAVELSLHAQPPAWVVPAHRATAGSIGVAAVCAALCSAAASLAPPKGDDSGED